MHEWWREERVVGGKGCVAWWLSCVHFCSVANIDGVPLIVGSRAWSNVAKVASFTAGWSRCGVPCLRMVVNVDLCSAISALGAGPLARDDELPHWIDATRSHAEKAVFAARVADMARHVANTASQMAIFRATALRRSVDAGSIPSQERPVRDPVPVAYPESLDMSMPPMAASQATLQVALSVAEGVRFLSQEGRTSKPPGGAPFRDFLFTTVCLDYIEANKFTSTLHHFIIHGGIWTQL